MRDVRTGKLCLFPKIINSGPKERRTPAEVREVIITYRKQQLSCKDIAVKLAEEGYKISKRTIENILYDSDFSKLPRRSAVSSYAYAQQRYRILTDQLTQGNGWECPMRGGKTKTSLTTYEREIDNKVRAILSQELGHSRIEITKIYCGR